MNTPTKRPSGIGRLIAAAGYSADGFRHALKNETAIREELTALLIFTPISVLLPVSRIEHLILVLSLLFIVLVEFLNSSIEATVDRISLERHPLAKQAKDMGSAAVLIAVTMCVLSWAVIVGPLAWVWLRALL